MTETAAAKAIRATQNMQPRQMRGILDKAAKNLVADRQILAWIVKSCVPEAAEYSLQQLAEECIPGEIQIAEVPMHREDEEAGMQADPGRARLDNTEDSSTADGTVYFDILFTLTLPQKTDPILMIINVEIQNRSDAGYPLESRAVTYACRLVSRQGTDYGSFKKVYSIWIVSNPSDKANENTIEQIGLFTKQGEGGIEPAPPEASLFEIRFLNLGAYEEARKSEAAQILQLMDVLFSRDLDADQKTDIVSRDFGIQMTTAASRNLQEVYTMELALETRARQEGERIGEREGAAQAIISLLKDMGAEESTIIDKLMQKLNVSKESALQYIAKHDTQTIVH